jgi:hypothetical protein
MLSFFSSRRNRCWGEGYTRWRERGWESPNSDEGNTLLYISTLWVVLREELAGGGGGEWDRGIFRRPLSPSTLPTLGSTNQYLLYQCMHIITQPGLLIYKRKSKISKISKNIQAQIGAICENYFLYNFRYYWQLTLVNFKRRRTHDPVSTLKILLSRSKNVF